jgi:S1-C subfamily serine protease
MTLASFSPNPGSRTAAIRLPVICGIVVLAGHLGTLRATAQVSSPVPVALEPDAIVNLVDSAKDSVVCVKAFADDLTLNPFLADEAMGSGIVVDADGHILTNAHLVIGASTVTVVTSDGVETSARVEAIDEDVDLAVLTVKPPRPGLLRPAALGDSNSVRTGQFVLTVGYPYGVRQSISFGIISAQGRAADKAETFLETDAAVHPGSSGGPLINLKGEVVGVVAAMFVGDAGTSSVNLVIPINVAKRFLSHYRARSGTQ